MEHKFHDNGSVVDPDVKTDYHGHPNYFRVLIYLLAMLGISLAVFEFHLPVNIAITIVFVVAFWKIGLVVRNFMHLRYEHILIWVAVFAAVFILLVFFLGVFPDVPMVHREVVPKY